VSAAYYFVKVAASAGLIVGISELSKRSTFAGALLASVPLVSVLAMIWIYIERDRERGPNAALCPASLSTRFTLLRDILFRTRSPQATRATDLHELPS
jgi:hypothetical protein